MKKLNRLVAVILLFAMTVSLTACSMPKKTKDLICGEWSTVVSVSEMVDGSVEDDDVQNLMDIDSMEFEYVISFNEDGTVKMYADTERIGEWFADFLVSLKDFLLEKIKSAIDEQVASEGSALDKIFSFLNIDGVSEFIDSALGSNIDEYVEKETESIYDEINEAIKSLNMNGTYYTFGNFIYVKTGKYKQIGRYNRKDDTITLKGMFGDKTTFTRR